MAKSAKNLNGLMPDMACLPSLFLLFGRVGVEDDGGVNCRQRAEVRDDRFEILGRRLQQLEPGHRGVERQRDLRGASLPRLKTWPPAKGLLSTNWLFSNGVWQK